MNKTILLIIILLFLTSCSPVSKVDKMDKNINDIISNSLEKELGEKDLEIEQLIIFQKLVSYIGIFIFAIFVGIVIIFLGVKKVGIGIVLSAITSIVLILGLSLYTKYVAIVGLLSILVGIYFLGKEIFNKNRFEKDLVKTVELAKGKINGGLSEFKNELATMQAKSTQRKIKKIKKKT